MNNNIKITVDDMPLCMPARAHETDAAFDLFTYEAVDVKPNTRCYISLGFKIALPSDIGLIVQPRSGQSGKGMIACAIAPKWLGGDIIKVRIDADVLIGLIDSLYGKDVKAIVKFGRMKWKHRLLRLIGFKFQVSRNSRICQGRFVSIPNVELVHGIVFGERDGLGSTDEN